jgi:quercetin dioxygenase-like cupin family protein
MTAARTRTAVVRTVDESERRWFYGGGVHDWKLREEETDGAFLLFEDTAEQGKVTPLHTHPAAETVYVLAGEIVMHIDGTDHPLGEGGVAMAPPGVPHAFKVVSPTARLLFLHTPGGCQAFYLAASEPMTEQTERLVDFDRIVGAAVSEGGIDIVGPPPFGP